MVEFYTFGHYLPYQIPWSVLRTLHNRLLADDDTSLWGEPALANRPEYPKPEFDSDPPARLTLPSVNLDGLMVVVIRRWRRIVATALIFGTGVLLALPFLTVSYDISASLLVKLGREQVPSPVAGATIQAAPFRRSEDVTSEIEILTSPALIEGLVNDFGVDYFTRTPQAVTLFQKVKAVARTVVRAVRDAWTEVLIAVGLEQRLTPFQRVVSTLQSSLTADAVKRSDVIDVRLLATDPEAGKAVLKRLLELHQAEHIRVFKTPGATRFLEGKVEAIKRQLAELEARRLAFGTEGAIWDFDSQTRVLLARRHDAQQSLARTRELQGQAQSELDQYAKAMVAPPEERRTQRVEQVKPEVQVLQGRVLERRAALASMRLNFTPDSERVRDEEAQLKELEELLGRTEANFVQSQTFESPRAREDVERGLTDRRNRVAGLEALAKRQATTLDETDAEIARVGALGETARQLARESQVVEASYRLHVQRLDEARINEALDDAQISNVAIITEPVASVRPVRPRSMLLFLAALVAGGLGSLAVFLLRDAIRPVVRTRERASEVLGVPVLVRLQEVRR